MEPRLRAQVWGHGGRREWSWETKMGAGDLTEESASEVGVRSRSCWEQAVG